MSKLGARIQTNLLGRIVTKGPDVTPGSYHWPVCEPIVFAPSFPEEHKAEIVGMYTDEQGVPFFLCRTPIKGVTFSIPATGTTNSVSFR